jgi:hypothetical protein
MDAQVRMLPAAAPLSSLNPGDIARCVRACAALRLPPQATWYFRRYLATWVEGRWPVLAQAVRRCSDAELSIL